jgi:hypothetical protein
METLKIVRVFVSDKKKDGTAIFDFRGNPARKVSIKTENYPEKWLYSFPSSKQDDPIFSITEKTAIKAIVWENNGFMNFKLPSKTDLLEARIERIEEHLFGGGKRPTDADPREDTSDLPF